MDVAWLVCMYMWMVDGVSLVSKGVCGNVYGLSQV